MNDLISNSASASNAKKILTPIKAIRANCIDCSGGSAHEVKLCVIPDCPLYPYRLGKNPNRKREYTDEQRREIAERFKKSIG